MSLKTSTLAQRVFDTIIARYAIRAIDIANFTRTKYSFEEWLNWEAFAACAAVSEWRSYAKPRYRDLGAIDCKDFGDLLVCEGSDRLLVEVGLVHDGTGNKWRDKLAWDVQKLARPLAEISCLHLVVLASAANIDASETWQRWLAKVPCWGRPDPLKASLLLRPSGQMLIHGWAG